MLKEKRNPPFELLVGLVTVENVNMSWLLAGTGTPYSVLWLDADAQCRFAFLEQVHSYDGTRVHLVASSTAEVPSLRCVVFVSSDELVTKRGNIEYTRVVIIAGGFGPMFDDVLMKHCDQTPVYLNTLESDDAQGIRQGLVCPLKLTSDAFGGPLLDKDHRLERADFKGDRRFKNYDTPVEYWRDLHANKDIAELAHNFQRLGEAERRTIRALVETMIEQDGKTWEPL